MIFSTFHFGTVLNCYLVCFSASSLFSWPMSSSDESNQMLWAATLQMKASLEDYNLSIRFTLQVFEAAGRVV